jgi:glycosyltransferase involved in cell wall biosynthesis
MSKTIYKNIIKDKSKTALIMCTYIRLENLQHTFTSLINQTNKDFDFYICDNSNNPEKLLKIISKYSVDFNLSIYDYGNDFKQFARFIVAQDLAKEGYERVIFIDDDQILPDTFIQDCYDQYEDGCVKSFWSHKVEKIYKSKIKLEKDELGNYAGTGGLVCSASIFLDEFFFTCPEQFWIIDDLWLSYYILKYTNLKIKTLNTKITFIIDKKATHLLLKEVKQNFAEQFIIPNSKHIPSLL